MATEYDLIVIGAGNAGRAAAGIAREAGWRVLIVESRDVGGPALVAAARPSKKVLVVAGEVLDQISRAGEHRIRVGPRRPSAPPSFSARVNASSR